MSFSAFFPELVRSDFALADLSPAKASVAPVLADMTTQEREQFDAVLGAARVLVVQRALGTVGVFAVALEQTADVATVTVTRES